MALVPLPLALFLPLFLPLFVSPFPTLAVLLPISHFTFLLLALMAIGSWSVFCVCMEGRPSSGLGGSPWVMKVTLTKMGSFYNKKFTIVFLF